MLFFNYVISKGVQKEPEDLNVEDCLYNLLPRFKMEKDFNRFKYWDKNTVKDKVKARQGYKIANARNPFARLYSAWHDKSRTHLFPNKSVDYSSFHNHHSNLSAVEINMQDHTETFHIPYYPGIEPFETGKPPDGMNYSFPARV